VVQRQLAAARAFVGEDVEPAIVASAVVTSVAPAGAGGFHGAGGQGLQALRFGGDPADGGRDLVDRRRALGLQRTEDRVVDEVVAALAVARRKALVGVGDLGLELGEILVDLGLRRSRYRRQLVGHRGADHGLRRVRGAAGPLLLAVAPVVADVAAVLLGGGDVLAVGRLRPRDRGAAPWAALLLC